MTPRKDWSDLVWARTEIEWCCNWLVFVYVFGQGVGDVLAKKYSGNSYWQYLGWEGCVGQQDGSIIQLGFSLVFFPNEYWRNW